MLRARKTVISTGEAGHGSGHHAASILASKWAPVNTAELAIDVLREVRFRRTRGRVPGHWHGHSLGLKDFLKKAVLG